MLSYLIPRKLRFRELIFIYSTNNIYCYYVSNVQFAVVNKSDTSLPSWSLYLVGIISPPRR